MKITKLALAALLAASLFSISCKEKTAEAQTSGSASVSKAARNAKPNAETDFEYQINGDLTAVKITGYIGKGDKIVVPETIQGLPVVMVNLNSGDATLCVIPGSVKYADLLRIGVDSKKSAEIVLSKGLEYLSLMANNIKSIDLPSTLKYLYFSENNDVKSLVLPDGIRVVLRIQGNALETITFPTNPAGKIFIGYGKYYGIFYDANLEQLNLPENPVQTLRVLKASDYPPSVRGIFWDSVGERENRMQTVNLRSMLNMQESAKLKNSVELQKKFNIEIPYPRKAEVKELVKELPFLHGNYNPDMLLDKFYGFKN